MGKRSATVPPVDEEPRCQRRKCHTQFPAIRLIPACKRLEVPNKRTLLVWVRGQVLVAVVGILAPRRQVPVAGVEILAPRGQVQVVEAETRAPREQALAVGVEIPTPKQLLAAGAMRRPVPLQGSGWRPMARCGAVRRWFTCLPRSWRRCGCCWRTPVRWSRPRN
jgi:hypothetical protein